MAKTAAQMKEKIKQLKSSISSLQDSYLDLKTTNRIKIKMQLKALE